MSQKNSSILLNKLILEEPEKFPLADIDAFEFLKNVAQNRMLYWLAIKYSKSKNIQLPVQKFLQEIKKIGDLKSNQFVETIEIIKKIALRNNLEYIIAKGEREYQYINSDIDLLIKEKDMQTWLNGFLDNKYEIKNHHVFMAVHNDQYNLVREGYYKVDITTQFNWEETNYFDNEFLWNGSNNHKLNIESNLITNMGSIIFKRMSINLIDYYYLKNINSKDINWDKIKYQAKKYNWEKSLNKFLNFFENIDPSKDEFPALFNFSLYSEIFKEKIKNRTFSINYFAYFILARSRYYLLNKKHLPFHVYWFPYKKLKELRGIKLTI